MSESFETNAVQRRYINTLTFLSFPLLAEIQSIRSDSNIRSGTAMIILTDECQHNSTHLCLVTESCQPPYHLVYRCHRESSVHLQLHLITHSASFNTRQHLITIIIFVYLIADIPRNLTLLTSTTQGGTRNNHT